MCDHAHGGQLEDDLGWLCGKCFKILEERPKIYHIASYSDRTGDDIGYRQEIKWQAEILKSADGTNLTQFIYSMVRRIVQRTGMDRIEATNLAVEIMRTGKDLHGIEFGDVDYCWSRLAAVDIVDEDMLYWDVDETSEGNG